MACIKISVVEMVKGKKRFKKIPSTLMEIEARRTDDYQTFATNAARMLNMDVSAHEELSLFKSSTGAKISIEGNEWTLGGYLRMLKKSPTVVTIGVGCVDTCESENEVRYGWWGVCYYVITHSSGIEYL